MLKPGKLPIERDSRTLQLPWYQLREQPEAPDACDWIGQTSLAWPAYGNDELGTCTVAAAAHIIHAWSGVKRPERVVLHEEVMRAYRDISGYDGRAQNDQGATALATLKYWRKVGIGGHRIDGFVSISASDAKALRVAMASFGGCMLGLQMPITAMAQEVWHVPEEPSADATKGSWGGHCVAALAYDAAGVVVVSCGHFVRVTWGFITTYADEAYAMVERDEVNGLVAPPGINRAALRSDLQRVSV